MEKKQIAIEATLQTVLLFISIFFMLTIILSPLALFSMLALLIVQLISSINRANQVDDGKKVVYIMYWILAGIGAIASIWLLFQGEWVLTYRCMLLLLAVMLIYFIISMSMPVRYRNEQSTFSYLPPSVSNEFQAQMWQAWQNEMARKAWENTQAWNNYYQQNYNKQQPFNF
jgi:hypothetical protein